MTTARTRYSHDHFEETFTMVRSTCRVLTTGSIACLLMTGFIIGPTTGSASADTTCQDGSRESAEAVAEAAPVSAPVGSVISGPRTIITLRYSDAYDCAWALIESNPDNLGPDDEAWIDRSFDGGRTWDPELGKRSRQNFSTSTYTAAYSVGQSSVRACGRGSWEESVDDGLLIPGPAGRIFNSAPEYETRYYDVVCTNWFPVAAPGADERAGQTPQTANWSIRDNFFGPQNLHIPVRVGWQDPFSDRGFGWLHIQARHPGQYNENRIEEVLEGCTPVPDGDNLRCEEDGYVVVYSDEYTEDPYIKGIITAFES